jgi:hypothetical protein
MGWGMAVPTPPRDNHQRAVAPVAEAAAGSPTLLRRWHLHIYGVRMTSSDTRDEPTRVLLFVQGTDDEAAAVRRLAATAGLAAPFVLTVTEDDADAVSAALPAVLERLTDLEVAVLVGPLASETWRRHPAFQLHLTLVDAPALHEESSDEDLARVHAALRGTAAMLNVDLAVES